MAEKQTSKKLNISVKKYWWIFLIVFVVILYIVIGEATKTRVEVNTINFGTVERSINIDVVLARKEVLYKSDKSGLCIADIPEGDIVAANRTIATIGSDTTNGYLKRIKKIESKIADYQKKNNIGTITSSEIDKLENSLYEEMRTVVQCSNVSDIDSIRKSRTSIDKISLEISNEKSKYYLNIPDIRRLVERKERYTNMLNEGNGIIQSKEAGTVSYCIDGREGYLTPDRALKIKPGAVKGILNNTKTINYAGANVESGQQCLKVCSSQETYLMGIISGENKENYSVAQQVQIRFNDLGSTCNGTVAAITQGKNNQYTLVLKVEELAYQLVSMRKTNIDIITSSYSGFKVEKSSLVNFNKEESTADIYIIIGNYARKRTVSVEGQESDWAIIDNITNYSKIYLYDKYIKEPENIEDGQIVYE